MKDSISGRTDSSPILQTLARAGAGMLPGLAVCLAAILLAVTLLPDWSGDEAIAWRLAISLFLVLAALALAMPIGFSLGDVASRQPGSLPGLLGRALDRSGPAMLSVLPAAMLTPFAVNSWTPAGLSGNRLSPGTEPGLLALLVAIFAITLPLAAYMTRISHRAHRAARQSAAVRTASGLGLPPAIVSSRYVRPIAVANSTAACTLLAMTAVTIAAVAETLFQLPGIGQLLLAAARHGAIGPVVAALAAICVVALIAGQATVAFLVLMEPGHRPSPAAAQPAPAASALMFGRWRHSRGSGIATAWLIALALAALTIPLFGDGGGGGTHPGEPVFTTLWAARYSLFFMLTGGLVAGLTGCLVSVQARLANSRSGERLLLRLAEWLSRLPLSLVALMLVALGYGAGGFGPAPLAGPLLALLVGFMPQVIAAALHGIPDPRHAEFILAAHTDGLSEQTIRHKHWLVSLRRPLIAAVLPVFPRLLAFELAAGLSTIPLPGQEAGGGLGLLLASRIAASIEGGETMMLDGLATTVVLALTGWALWVLAARAAETGR